jgi:hypothetical protein
MWTRMHIVQVMDCSASLGSLRHRHGAGGKRRLSSFEN